jgi:leucyl/phenylalanyl-tRNA--protein transferase
MAESREGGGVNWYAPDPRGVIVPAEFTPGRHNRRLMRTHPFEIRINTAFVEVMRACAEPRPHGESETWISPDLVAAYTRLHDLGYAHSIETWLDERLVGGAYLVQLGRATMGESMFRREPNADKVAILALIQRLRERGFVLLDVQFVTPHLRQFGAVEIRRGDYEQRLAAAIVEQPPVPFAAGPRVIPAPAARRPGEQRRDDA